MQAFFIIIVLLSGFFSVENTAAQEPADPYATADPGTVRALLTPLTESTLSSQIAGKIRKINVKNGDTFRKGKRLIEFDCDIQNAQLLRAKADLLAAKKTHEGNLRLKEYNSVSETEVAVSAAGVDKSKAIVSLEAARSRMCKIDAPFNGRVIKRIARPFESVTQGQPLIEILDDSQLKVELYVPSRWLLWLKADTRFSIHIDETGKTYPAHVSIIGARVDAVSQSIEITAEIEGDHPELLAGMSGEARFNIPEQQ